MTTTTSASASASASTESGRRWAAFRARVASITPESIARSVLALAVIAVALLTIRGTWPALAPFVAGAVIAYAVMPIANRLDPFMPRVLAAIIAELVALAVIVGVIVLVVPPLVNGLSMLAAQIPTGEKLDERLAQLQAQLGTLPEPARSIVSGVLTDVITNLQAALEGFVEGLAAFVTAQILGIFETASFLLGLLVIPVWILTVVADERPIKRRALAAVSPAIRADVYALFRIIDRSLSAFLRVQLLQAVVVGTLTWLGLVLAEELGIIDIRYEVAAGAILGLVQVVPQLGFIIGFVPMLLVLPVSGTTTFVVVVVVYLVANRLAAMLVARLAGRGVLEVHPALMIPGLVAIGQLGLVPLLAGAPIIVIARDTVRYLHGRFAEPPKPAGLLPGDPRWAKAALAPATATGAAGRSTATARSVERARSAAPDATPATPYVPAVYRTARPAAAPSPSVTAQPASVTEWSAQP